MSLKYIGYSTRFTPLKIYETPIRPLGPSQLLINVSYIGINPIDVKLKSIALIPWRYQVGKDFSGSVEGVGGSLKSEWKVGDRICGGMISPLQGTLGTKAILDVKKHAILHTPEHLSDAEAAAFPLTFGTAFEMLKNTSKSGNLLVIGGATNVGTYAIQLAKKMYNFDEIVAVASAASKNHVLSLGADRNVDYKSGDVSEQLKSLGIKFDVILDTVGGYDALKVWPEILKRYSEGGVYVTIAGDIPPSGSYKNALIKPTLLSAPWVVPRLLFGKYMGINYQLLAVKGGNWADAVSDFFKHSDVKTPIDSIYDLSNYQEAWNRIENMKARGKVLVSMNE